MNTEPDTRRTLIRGGMKRRGLMAGAAALVAGLLAREVADAPPVAAITDTYFIANGPAVIGFNALGSFTIGAASVGSLYGVDGRTYGTSVDAAGVFGQGNGINTRGVYGYAGDAGNGTGVLGRALGGGYGVSGSSESAIGVYGTTTSGYGVVGYASPTSVAALYGSSASAGAPAFAAYNGVAGGLAGTFQGKVYINGDFIATGGVKSAAVPHPDGSHRLLYCVESPESWFEDFGESTLTAGKAEVKLDSDFAAVVDTSTLHVFCMPHDDTHTLHLTARSGSGFTVSAATTGAATARGVKAADVSGTFTWRVVAKRKDVQAARLAKVDLPKIPAPPPPPPAEPKPKAPELPKPPKA